MTGNAEDNASEVADIILINDSGSVFSRFGWQVHAATPPGNYHIRMNATIYDSFESRPGAMANNPIGNYVGRSPTFPIMRTREFACTIPQWAPVRSVSDLGYSPLRLSLPNGGDVYYLANSSQPPQISPSIRTVDGNFDRSNVTMTFELVNTGTGESAGVQKLSTIDVASSYQILEMDNFKVTAGAWKLRANYSTPGRGNLVALSDEFYIASQDPCGGLVAGNATTPASDVVPPSVTPTAGSVKLPIYVFCPLPAIAVSIMMLLA